MQGEWREKGHTHIWGGLMVGAIECMYVAWCVNVVGESGVCVLFTQKNSYICFGSLTDWDIYSPDPETRGSRFGPGDPILATRGFGDFGGPKGLCPRLKRGRLFSRQRLKCVG